MPAVSKNQQELFGLALSVKRGETPRSEVSDDVKKIVDKMSEKEIKKFAKTKHKGLPTKKEQKMNEQADSKYMLNFPQDLYKVLQRKNLGSWEPEYQRMSGTLGFHLKDDDAFQVYATPFWEGENEVPVDIQVTGRGRDRYDHITTIPLEATGDFNTDMKNYLKKIIPVLNDIKRKKDKYV